MAKRDPRRGLGELAMQTPSWLLFDVLWPEMCTGADEEAQAWSLRLQAYPCLFILCGAVTDNGGCDDLNNIDWLCYSLAIRNQHQLS